MVKEAAQNQAPEDVAHVLPDQGLDLNQKTSFLRSAHGEAKKTQTEIKRKRSPDLAYRRSEESPAKAKKTKK